MKQIILIRHAKSSWEHDISDHQRPLNKRGFNDASLISKELNGKINPAAIWSSDAMRAKTTAEIFISNLNFQSKGVNLIHELYDFTGNKLINEIKGCSDNISELMIFGHNNAITNFVNHFGNIYIENVPTSGVVIIQFETKKWLEIQKGKTIFTLFPRDLK